MSKRHIAIAIFFVFSAAGTALAQSNKVDFGREVLPILRENCVGCHGPLQQNNNFRLDRRSIALRGGTRTVLIPGSPESSRLYLRISGQSQFGNLMPPMGKLTPDKIEIIKNWIKQGADWPDQYANEEELPPPDVKAVRLIEALKAGDTSTVQKLIADDPKTLNSRGPEGTSPFMASVLYNDAATIGQLIAKGGDVNKPNDAGATPLMWAATNIAKVQVLLDHGADPNARSKDGRTPLQIAATQAGNTPVVKLIVEHGGQTDPELARAAAAAGDFEMLQYLMSRGLKAGESLAAAMEADCSRCVDVIAKTVDGQAATEALQALSVGARPANIKFVLDRGANANTADAEGRSALMNVANSDRMPVESVKMLLEHGADVNAKNNAGQTVLDMAKLHGNSPITEMLIKAGAKPAAAGPKSVVPLKSNTIDAAVTRSLPQIQKADVTFMQKSGCTSCHNEGVTQITVGIARKTGFKVDEAMSDKQIQAVQRNFALWKDRLLQGVAPGGVAYTLVGLHEMGYKPDEMTDAIARDIRMHQLSNGNWRPGCGGSRSPLCGFEISNTALSLRALQFYGLKQDRADYDKVIQRAADWLVKATPEVTEDRAFRLLGLVWAGKDKATIQKAMKDVLDIQRPDGGWSDVPTVASGAYATGQSLVALHEAGLPASDPSYQRGIKFLLSSQLEDGSWYQKTRSLPVQPYFDAGFPHGFDQWISLAGTSWATAALAYGSEGKHSTVAAGR